MAHKDGKALNFNESYTLGEYTFAIQSEVGEEGYTIEAQAEGPEGEATESITIPLSSDLINWRVDANDTTADVYITARMPVPSGTGHGSYGNTELYTANIASWEYKQRSQDYTNYRVATLSSPASGDFFVAYLGTLFAVSVTQGVTYRANLSRWTSRNPTPILSNFEGMPMREVTIDGVTRRFYMARAGYAYYSPSQSTEFWDISLPISTVNSYEDLYRILFMGGITFDTEVQEVLVGRFAIDAKDAGGTGPESDWEDPEDEEPTPLTLTLDKSEGEPGDSFTATIDGRNDESIAFQVSDESGSVYYSSTMRSSMFPFMTGSSWVEPGTGSKGFVCTATAQPSGRSSSATFTLDSGEGLSASFSPATAAPDETVDLTISGHNGKSYNCVLTNSEGTQVLSLSGSPSDDSDAVHTITLDEDWYADDRAAEEPLIATVVTIDLRTCSASCTMVRELPTHTLNVEIQGALSGRHNDPLNVTSYSYLPADKDTIKDYGCGGDGGHGGGGGGGASSVVVYKFTTNRAENKEVVVKPQRHGYGSGGGKGGKGGDGCILIYY